MEGGTGEIVYPQEAELDAIFNSLSTGFQSLEGVSNTSKQQDQLKKLTGLMQEAKSLIRDFEREAKLENMPLNELNTRKRALVQELNGYISLKKAYSTNLTQRGELLAESSSTHQQSDETERLQGMATTELMTMGRRDIKTIDDSLVRSERLVNDTVAIGVQTAETLQGQGKQLEKVMDDLDEIHFTMKKARQVLRDMTRGLATDKCIMSLLLLTVVAILVVIVLKILDVDGVSI